MGKPNLDVFAETLLELASADRDVLAVTSDSRGSGRLTGFGQRLPEQIVETGIAEQNVIGIAAGLASAGKKVFAVSPACFITARSLEQIKNDVCYSDHPVTVVGISAGVSYGALGATHHSLHDCAVLRAIHNITILAPADNLETREAVKYACCAEHPVYIRLGKAAMPDVHPEQEPFVVGRAARLREGRDVTLIATGETVPVALGAAEALAQRGTSARVLSMHTVKPLDEAAVLAAADETGAVVTLEEHSVYGGLGEACAAVLMRAGRCVPFDILAFPDEALVAGSQREIFAHYGLTVEGVAHTVSRLQQRRALRAD
ncbi:MAG: transketolase family protein [Anaerolineae bacterium]